MFDKAGISDSYAWTFTKDTQIHFVVYQGAEIIGYAHLQLWPYQRAVMRIIGLDEIKRIINTVADFNILRKIARKPRL